MLFLGSDGFILQNELVSLSESVTATDNLFVQKLIFSWSVFFKQMMFD